MPLSNYCCLVIVLAPGVFPLLCFVSFTVLSEVLVCVRDLPIASKRDFPDNIHVITTNRLESPLNPFPSKGDTYVVPPLLSKAK